MASSLFAGSPQQAPSYAATTSDVPKWLQDYTVDLFSQQRAVAATPYQPYALPRIAQTTAPTTASQNLIQSSVGAYQPAVGGAISGTQDLAGQSSVNNINAYMNPYTQNVTDQIARLGARNLSENLLPAVSDQFIRAGQFGSSGMGTFGERALRDTQESILANQTSALNTGYTQALGASQADLTRQQGAQQQVADLAKMQQGLTTADAAALESIGTAQQQQQQRGLDVAYQDYQNQIQYPQTQINNMSTTLRGLPPTAVPTTGTQTGYSTTFTPSPLSQVAGAFATYKGLTSAKGGLIQGYADGGAVTADPSQELSDLEKSVMADYGQYHYKTIDLPQKLVNPTAMPNWAKVIARRPNAEAQRAKQLAILSGHLPAGVKMVGNQLQIDDTYSKYSLDNPAQLYNSVRQYANQQNNLDLYNAKLAKEGKPAVTEIPKTPKHFGFNPVAAQSRNINFGIPTFNVLADPLSDSVRTRSGLNFGSGIGIGNIGMGGLGLGMRMNAKKPYTPLIANEGTRSMDDALQQYLNKGGNNMSLDALKQQIALGKAPAPTIDPQALYSSTTVPAAPDMSSQLEDLNAKYYSQPVAMSHGGRVPGYAEEGYVDTENPADLVDGGQAFADQYAQGQQEYPAQQDVPMQAPSLSSYMQDPEVVAANAQRKALLKQLEASLSTAPANRDNGPTESEMWFNRAAAFLDPGKTGSFGEGLQHMSVAEAGHQAEKRKARLVNQAADLQRLQARSELAQKQYEMTMDEGKRRTIEQLLTPTSRSTEGATVGGGAGIPDNMKAMILSLDPAEAIKTIIDIAKENNSPKTAVGAINYAVEMGIITREEGNAIIKQTLQPKVEMSKVWIPELGSDADLTQAEVTKYTTSGVIPTRYTGEKQTPAQSFMANTPSSPVSAVATQGTTAPSAVPTAAAPTVRPRTKEQVAADTEQLKEAGKKKVEASDTLLGKREAINDQLTTVRRFKSIINKDPSIIGLTNKPGIGGAFVEGLKQGIDTPIGKFGINLEEPIAKATLSEEQLANRDFAKQAFQDLIIGYRKMFLKGEGPVSNMEGALVEKLPPGMEDTHKGFMLKAGVVEIRAEKQQATVNGFSQYLKNHPTAGPEDYYNTPEFKRISDSYDNKYSSFLKQNGFDLATLATPTKKPSGSEVFDTLNKDPRFKGRKDNHG